jgi:hypothetical protein
MWEISVIRFFITLATIGAIGATAADLDFNRDVRPVLFDKCVACHGPDSAKRKADLRLDTFEDATKKHEWGAAIVPGKPEQSSLVDRITHPDIDERMPPEKSAMTLTDAEIKLLSDWVKSGAQYDTHWAFKPPVQAPPPQLTKDLDAWASSPIDHFVAHRLSALNVKPSPLADKRTLLRRVTLDLTGLPPTQKEIRAFVDDESPHAYEKAVDRLLASPRYGERMTLVWMDAARYADTGGYQSDNPRTMWPWRDWVIRAYNANLPFDQFTIEQLAGDMLPEPTQQQQLATGFNRNHRINNEGGVLAEEFIVEYVADRTETTGAVWLGLTIGCARCHDHKYDPLSQREYFEMFAYFNNVPEKGKAAGNATPTIKVPSDPDSNMIQKMKLDLEALQTKLDDAKVNVEAEQKAWEAELSAPITWTTVAPEKVTADSGAVTAIDEDGSVRIAADNIAGDRVVAQLQPDVKRVTAVRLTALPSTDAGAKPFVLRRFGATVIPRNAEQVAGRYVRIELPGKKRYLSLSEVQVFDGDKNVALKKAAKQSTTGFSGPAKLAVDGKTSSAFSSKTITHTLEESDPWWEVDLAKVQNISRIVVWNRAENVHDRLDGFQIKILNEKREVLYTDGLKKATPKAMGFDVSGARALPFEYASASLSTPGYSPKHAISDSTSTLGWSIGRDKNTQHAVFAVPTAAKVSRGASLELALKTDVPLRRFMVSITDDPRVIDRTALPASITRRLKTAADKRKAKDAKVVTDYFLENAQSLRGLRARIKKQEDAIAATEKKNTVTVMVMTEMDKPRPTYLLERGQYHSPDKSEELKGSVPEALRKPELRPKNRLEFARWLVSAENPLTARVTVNRYWQMYFGTGLVKTTEDFGTQGEYPSHPQLLDWLAVDFVDSGWNVKAMQKRIVMSSTYRQRSVARPELREQDPQNRLLAHGPRFRMTGEAIRDQALAVSGLLNPRIGGAPVKPYQPAGLWQTVGGRANDRYVQDKGESLYRRSMYTYWRRAVNPPRLTIFDAASRDACNVRLRVTNTPLQALVLLNDVTFAEAARALAQRMLTEWGDTPQSRISAAYEAATARPIDDRTFAVLNDSLAFYQKSFAADTAAAEKFSSVGESERPKDLDAVQLAAYTAVANTILNLDEVITKE